MSLNKLILLVEDNPVSQKIHENFLRENQFDVQVCWNAEECVNFLEKVTPDLILMDVILPGVNGKDIVRRLQAHPTWKNIPIIFTINVIGLAEDKGDIGIQVDDKVYRAFAKPLHERKVISTIRKEINRMQSGGELSPNLKIQI